MTKSKPFLGKLDSATSQMDCGVYVFNGFLSPRAANDAFLLLKNDSDFPWELKPKLFGEQLKQHAYKHYRYKYSASTDGKKQPKGLDMLESICSKLDHEFDVEISFVYCNRFQDAHHMIDWHKDTFGDHILVLTLGAERRIEFRENVTREIESVIPKSGDLYLMPLYVNKTHKHKVCSAIETGVAGSSNKNTTYSNDGTRLSFVFFFKPPKYAKKQFRITMVDKAMGLLESLFE